MKPAIAALVAAVTVTGLAVVPAAPAAAIVGGQEADAGEWPWQVAIIVDGAQYCGGVLVTEDAVLTAAHCTDGVDAGDMLIVAGTVDLDDGDAQRREVVDVRQHEDYDDITTENDISVLRLSEPMELSDTVAAATIPDAETEAEITEEGDPAFVTGFGATDENGPPSDVLLEAEVDVYDDEHCEDNYDRDGDEVFGETQVCAGIDAGGVDSCYGDSGGPLVAPTPDGGVFYLIGLVSWGAGCGVPERPTIHTQVTQFVDWLGEQGVDIEPATRVDSDVRLRLPAVGTRGKASQYPSTVAVERFEGRVEQVSVVLHGLTHGRMSDLDIWLVAPGGTVVTLLSDVGGDNPVDDRTFVIVDGAGELDGALPDVGRMAPSDLEADNQR
ncbi:MAG: DUF1986 domain-containing protein, partial [Acidimicrobiales bacterium]